MATVKYFGPGGQSVTLGSEIDKWAGLNATSASIDSFKSVGNASTPVYFDENGVPQAVTSSMDDTELKKEVASIKDTVTEITEGSTAVGVAKKLANARTITLTGDASGSASFDGSENVSLNVSVSGGSSGGASGARVVVYVPLSSVVTCTDSTGTEVAVKTAETEAKVEFDLSYGTYTFSTPTAIAGVNDTETVRVTDLKIYNITLNGIPNASDAYELDIVTEADSVVTVTNGDVVQTKAVTESDPYVAFSIPDGTTSSTVSVTKEGVTRTETVSFGTDEYKKTVKIAFAKMCITGKVGQTVIISKDSYSYTVIIELANKPYITYLPELGTWSLVATASDGEVISKTEDVTTYKSYYMQCNTKIYAFKINGAVSDPAKMITYLETNKDFTPAKMNYNTGEFDWGSWDSQDFFMPRPCMLKYDGTVDYYLDENYYGLKAGTDEVSDVANPDYEGNAMMEWGRYGSKIWYKIMPTNKTSATVYIANYQADSGYHAWSFINSEGEMVDHFYTPIYNGSLINGKMRSISGQEATTNLNATQEITYAEANNPSSKKMWYTEVYADVLLINLLLMLLGRNMDTQTTFGYGNGDGSKQITGSLDSYGMFYGTQSADTKGVKVFGMENWWGNVYRRYAGHVTDSSYQQLVKLTYGKQDGSTTEGYNTTGSGYIATGIALSKTSGSSTTGTSGYITQETYSNTFGMVHSGFNSGSATTCYCDYGSSYTSCYAIRGGYWSYSAGCGAFDVNLSRAASNSSSNLGAAISCKP